MSQSDELQEEGSLTQLVDFNEPELPFDDSLRGEIDDQITTGTSKASAREFLNSLQDDSEKSNDSSPKQTPHENKTYYNGLDLKPEAIPEEKIQEWNGWYHSPFEKDYPPDFFDHKDYKDLFSEQFKPGTYQIVHTKKDNNITIMIIRKKSMRRGEVPKRPVPIVGISGIVSCHSSNVHTLGKLDPTDQYAPKNFLGQKKHSYWTTYIPDNVKRWLCMHTNAPIGVLSERFKSVLKRLSYEIDCYIYDTVGVDHKDRQEADKTAKQELDEKFGEDNYKPEELRTKAIEIFRTVKDVEKAHYRRPFWEDDENPGEMAFLVKHPIIKWAKGDNSKFGYNVSALHMDFEKKIKGGWKDEVEKDAMLQRFLYRKLTKLGYPPIIPTYFDINGEERVFECEFKDIHPNFLKEVLRHGSFGQLNLEIDGVFSGDYYGSKLVCKNPQIHILLTVDMKGRILINVKLHATMKSGEAFDSLKTMSIESLEKQAFGAGIDDSKELKEQKASMKMPSVAQASSKPNVPKLLPDDSGNESESENEEELDEKKQKAGIRGEEESDGDSDSDSDEESQREKELLRKLAERKRKREAEANGGKKKRKQ